MYRDGCRLRAKTPRGTWMACCRNGSIAPRGRATAFLAGTRALLVAAEALCGPLEMGSSGARQWRLQVALALISPLWAHAIGCQLRAIKQQSAPEGEKQPIHRQEAATTNQQLHIAKRV